MTPAISPAEKNVASAVAYYRAMSEKDLAGMECYLHPGIELISPIDSLIGKDAVLDAAKRLFSSFKRMKLQTRFGSDDQVILTYDMDFGAPVGVCRTAVLITFRDALIARSELFFDATPFHKR